MDSAQDGSDVGEVSSRVDLGKAPRVDVVKKQRSFMEKLIGVRNSQCELYLAKATREIDKCTTANMRHIQGVTNQIKYDYKLLQVNQQRNELHAKQRLDPSVDLEYEEFLIQQTEKYLIYNPSQCFYTDKAMRYPARSTRLSSQHRVTPALARARRLLQQHQLQQTSERQQQQQQRNVRFELEAGCEEEEEEEVATGGVGGVPRERSDGDGGGGVGGEPQESRLSGMACGKENGEVNERRVSTARWENRERRYNSGESRQERGSGVGGDRRPSRAPHKGQYDSEVVADGYVADGLNGTFTSAAELQKSTAQAFANGADGGSATGTSQERRKTQQHQMTSHHHHHHHHHQQQQEQEQSTADDTDTDTQHKPNDNSPTPDDDALPASPSGRLLTAPLGGMMSSSEASMESLRQRLRFKQLVEQCEMAPYQVLLDENKELPPGKYPDPEQLWDAAGQLYGLPDACRLPAISRSQTMVPLGTSRQETLLRSRSDTFFRQPLASSSQVASFSGHRRRSVSSALSEVQSRSTTSARGGTTAGIRTRPVTHAMLKKEKVVIEKKLGAFLQQMNAESATRWQRERARPDSGGDAENMGDATTSCQPNEAGKTTGSPSQSATTKKTDSPCQLTAARATSRAGDNAKAKRGIPNHAAERSQRHTATFKLRRMMAALMKQKSKVELMQMEQLREGETAGGGGDTATDNNQDIGNQSA